MVAVNLRRASSAALALSLSLIAACGGGSSANRSCTSTAQCGAGQVCQQSECVATGSCASTQLSCNTRANCPSGQECLSGCCAAVSGCFGNSDCADPAKPSCDLSSHACKPCSSNGQCSGGKICTSAGRCEAGCSSDAGCPGGKCFHGADASFCGACATDAQCTTTKPFCVAGQCFGCSTNADCSGATPACDTASHKCAPCVDSANGADGKNPLCTGAGKACVSDACVACAPAKNDPSTGVNGACPQATPTCDASNTCVAIVTGPPRLIGFGPAAGSYVRVGEGLESAFPSKLFVTLDRATPSALTVAVATNPAGQNVVTLANGGQIAFAPGEVTKEVQLTANLQAAAVGLRATLNGDTKDVTVRVLGAAEGPTQLALTPATSSLAAGATQAFTLTTDLPVPASTTVDLNYGASASSLSSPPAQVAFPLDVTSTQFNLTASASATTGSTQITATLTGTAVTSQATVNFTGAVAACTPSQLVISQIYGGGGSTSTSPVPSYKYDWIELHNRGTTPFGVAANSYSLQYKSAASQTTTFGASVLAAATIPAGGYLLVRQATAACTINTQPAPCTGADITGDDNTSSLSLSATAGKVALVRGTTALTFTGTTPTAAAGEAIIDFVGYGPTANNYEGTGPAPAPSINTSIIRANAGCTDTDQNATEFAALAPAPRTSGSPPSTCAVCGGTQ